MTIYAPIILPPLTDPSWQRAKTIVAAFRARGKQNPLIVAGIVNGYGEAAWKAVIDGDHDESFGPWQLKWAYYGKLILSALGIDIRTEPDLAKHVDAVLWALEHAKVLDALEAASAGEDATLVWARDFEKASAGGAVDRRVAIAGPVEVAITHFGW